MGNCCGNLQNCDFQDAEAETGIDPNVREYCDSMFAQWEKILHNPQKLIDTAASKRSPFKFEVENSKDQVDLRLGVSAVALPDGHTDFGKRYLAMIDKIQDLCKQYIPEGCKRQTTPHMSIGSVFLDKSTPQEFNEEVKSRTGLIANSKKLLDVVDPSPRAKIQTLKINPDGCITLQLEHDPAQDKVMTQEDFEAALAKIPTCKAEDDAAKERKKFKANEDGTFTVSRFQQIRMELGGLGCEIKGMWPSGHMVVANLVDVDDMKKIPRNTLNELWAKCYEVWSPLRGEWFELKKILSLCYVERSLNEGSVVVAPAVGDSSVTVFPETSASAASLLGGIFKCNDSGDIFIDIEKFEARCADREKGQWQSFNAEVREMAENQQAIADLTKHNKAEQIMALFKTYDKDGSGAVTASEIGEVMADRKSVV